MRSSCSSSRPTTSAGYYEFEVNPANATMELFLPARNAGGYPRFKNDTKIEMKTAVQLHGTLNHWQDKDQGWSVEGRIPWRDLAVHRRPAQRRRSVEVRPAGWTSPSASRARN